MASQITSLTIVYSIVYSDVDQRKHQSPASLAFVRGTPFNSPHKGPVTRKMFPVNDVIKCGPRIYPGPALKGLMFNWTKNAVEVIDCVEQPHILLSGTPETHISKLAWTICIKKLSCSELTVKCLANTRYRQNILCFAKSRLSISPHIHMSPKIKHIYISSTH